VLFMTLCFIIGCSLVFLAISSTFPNHLSTSSPLPLSPHYNPQKVLLIVMCMLRSSGRELENLDMFMVVCIVVLNLECLGVIFGINVPNYMIYTLISSIMLRFCLFQVYL